MNLPAISQTWNPLTDARRAALDSMITLQAQIIAYIDDYKLLMIATLAMFPLLAVFKKVDGGGGDMPWKCDLATDGPAWEHQCPAADCKEARRPAIPQPAAILLPSDLSPSIDESSSASE